MPIFFMSIYTQIKPNYEESVHSVLLHIGSTLSTSFSLKHITQHLYNKKIVRVITECSITYRDDFLSLGDRDRLLCLSLCPSLSLSLCLLLSLSRLSFLSRSLSLDLDLERLRSLSRSLDDPPLSFSFALK